MRLATRPLAHGAWTVWTCIDDAPGSALPFHYITVWETLVSMTSKYTRPEEWSIQQAQYVLHHCQSGLSNRITEVAPAT